MKYELDVGIKLSDNNFGSHVEWSEINENLKEVVGVEEESAGTGFGVRDMQFSFDTLQEASTAGERVKDFFKERVEYANIATTDDEGWYIDEDGNRIVEVGE